MQQSFHRIGVQVGREDLDPAGQLQRLEYVPGASLPRSFGLLCEQADCVGHHGGPEPLDDVRRNPVLFPIVLALDLQFLGEVGMEEFTSIGMRLVDCGDYAPE
ncbi:hypothetical protein DL991_10100 [Amycolatopsis sp. WAC 01375]|nr:hypothetical protein DL991_10100 [Amycolatopsis sp. WAC 01375]